MRAINSKKNVIVLILSQIIACINGLIIPKLIILKYGSETNGLIITINQFLAFITLIESGVGSVFQSSLYDPIKNKDFQAISDIYWAQKHFYRRISIICICYFVILAICLPKFITTNIPANIVTSLTLIISVNIFFDYYVSIPCQTIIIADQKIRVVSAISSAITILNMLATVLFIQYNSTIVTLRLGIALIALLKPLCFIFYFNKNYVLYERGNNDYKNEQILYGMMHHIAYFIHSNVDIILLSLFVGTKVVSVYGIYYGIIICVKSFVTTISSGVKASIGDLLKTNNKKNIEDNIDIYEFIQFNIATFMFTVTLLMISPFIVLYSENIHDIKYLNQEFGIIFIIGELIYCYRIVYSIISMTGNMYKETQVGALIEAFFNVVVSVALIVILKTIEQKLIGVAIGTLIGMSFRFIYEIVFLKYNLIYRPIIKSLRTLLSNISIILLSCFIARRLISLGVSNWIEWIIKSIWVSLIVVFISTFINLLFNYRITLITIKKFI